MILGAMGTIVAFAGWGLPSAGGFFVGAAISLVSIHSWFRFSEMISGQGGRPGTLSAVLLVLRYALIAAAAYVTIKVLGSSPVAMMLGLLVAFAAVLLDLVAGLRQPK